MSILIKGTNGSGSSSSKGFPPGDVTNISIYYIDSKVHIKFSDPNDTVENGTTLATWGSTILVRKEGSAPKSPTDGTIVLTNTTKNKYKDTEFIDSNVSANKTYYYRFYILSTDKVYNGNTNMIKIVNTTSNSSTLKNNTWECISGISEAGMASSLWSIGDEINITLSGTFNETITLQIWDFNHFDKSDGSGKAGICFGMKNLMSIEDYMDNGKGHGNEAGWSGCYMRRTIMENIYASIPSDLKKHIKKVIINSTGGGGHSVNTGNQSDDYIFLPGLREVTSPDQYSDDIRDNFQKQFPIFTDNNSRIKKLSNGSGAVDWWWSRDPYPEYYTGWTCVNSSGVGVDNVYGNPNGAFKNDVRKAGICFCFNV